MRAVCLVLVPMPRDPLLQPFVTLSGRGCSPDLGLAVVIGLAAIAAPSINLSCATSGPTAFQPIVVPERRGSAGPDFSGS